MEKIISIVAAFVLIVGGIRLFRWAWNAGGKENDHLLIDEELLDEELAREAARWAIHEANRDWEDAPERVPRASGSVGFVRISETMLKILKEFARRKGVYYGVLVNEWLYDRIKKEQERLGVKGKSDGHH